MGISAANLPITALSHVQKIDLYGDNGVWSFPSVAMESLEDVRLSFSMTSPTWVYEILKFSRKLKVFHWSTWEIDWANERNKKVSWGYRQKGLNEALLQGADTLETLHLDTIAGDYAPEMLPRTCQIVTCLPSFKKLYHLTIDLTKLFGSWSHRKRNGLEDIPVLLPKSLRTLQLIERLYAVQEETLMSGDPQTVGFHETWLETMLFRCFEGCREGRWPELRQLRFRAADIGYYDPIKLVGRRSSEAIDAYKAAFAGVGIDFVWQEYDNFDRPPGQRP
ncbi:Uu.00g052260.m01.CDS01 [Anthostomella pinea]|uniref:Uu.00g052260.m01.CDS01 n=1 Tax=Anthostomella pinea TaxID=933095 RepID=A0AAI8VW89_9PEZI|nr:Uu.00g052260.m01.CDS01 [Anthostomella pinea]